MWPENQAEPMEGLGPADAHLEFRGLSADQNAYIVVPGLGELQLQPFALNDTHTAGFEWRVSAKVLACVLQVRACEKSSLAELVVF